MGERDGGRMGYVGGDGDGDGTGAMLHFFILDLFMNDVS